MTAAGLVAQVERTVAGLGYEFVSFERLPRGLVRVTIDTVHEGGVGLADCEVVSDQLTALFAVEDFDYARLEVSSPGVDRPLKKAADWRRFTGCPVHVELYEPLHAPGLPAAGRRRFDGRVIAVTGGEGCETVEFSCEEMDIPRTPSQAARARRRQEAEPVRVSFPLSAVDRANLIPQLDFKGVSR